MSVEPLLFAREGTATALHATHDLHGLVTGWDALRSTMARQRPDGFTRNEWAYLIAFLAAERLVLPVRDMAGAVAPSSVHATRALVPYERVSLWLPNNVSLLGCLALVLVSLTGAQVRVKAGSRSTDLVSTFIGFALAHSQASPLLAWLDRVSVEQFDRTDARNLEMSQWAQVRMCFGSDESAAAIEALPHRAGFPFFAFGSHQSEAWWSAAAATDAAAVAALAKVFAVYGQAGCTSPRRVFIVDGSEADARALMQTFGNSWNSMRPVRVAQAAASEVVMADQLARAEGLQTLRLPDNGAVLVASPRRAAPRYAHMGLEVQWGSLEDALATAPANLQTVGHPFAAAAPPRWAAAFARSAGNRLVPVLRMHDFSHVWDGMRWWEQLFRTIET